MKWNKFFNLIAFLICLNLTAKPAEGQNITPTHRQLTNQEECIIKVSALTALGDTEKLTLALHSALETGLSVNEIKEMLVHTYAYCGFPRSIRGLQTFMEVLKSRSANSLADKPGKEASAIAKGNNKYERGKNVLSSLTKMPPADKPVGYAAFAPVIDTLLKEHLFADLFERDVLTHVHRELVTISVIATIGRADSMLQSHFGILLNLGMTANQLQSFTGLIAKTIGETAANSAQLNLNEVLQKRASQ